MSAFKKELSDEEKTTYIRALICVLGGKNNLSDEHKSYLKHQAEEIGMSAAEFRKVPAPKNTDELAKEIKKIASVCLRRFILREMIMLAIADHEITDEEMKTIYAVGINAGIKEDKINDFFIWAAKGLEWQLEGECLIEK